MTKTKKIVCIILAGLIAVSAVTGTFFIFLTVMVIKIFRY